MATRKILSNITNLPSVPSFGKENRVNSKVESSRSAFQIGMIRENDEEVENIQDNLSIPHFTVPFDEVSENIDVGDVRNEFACSVYAEDVYIYLHDLEIKHKLPSNFLQIQAHITPKLRAYCVDSQVDLHRQLSQKFGRSLQIDTLFLSISILDHFLSRKPIGAEKLHLAGIGAFFIACKYEETYYPSINQLLRFVPEAGKKDDVLRMEQIILTELRYSLGLPTSIVFLKRYAKAAHADSTIGMVSRFISEYSLSSYSLCANYLPSVIAAAATCHALRIMGRQPWTATLIRYTGYTYEELRPCLIELRDLIKKAPLLKTQAIYKKYSDSKYLKAAITAVQKI